MTVKQISIFLENKSGRLAEVTQVLADNNIDIRALHVADTTDFGILRLIVNNPDKAEEVLAENGYTVSSTKVIAIEIEDKPGGLAKALAVLRNVCIGIEYMYAFITKKEDKALVIIRVEDIDKAVAALTKGGITVLSPEKVHQL